jgi:hypothetical protein
MLIKVINVNYTTSTLVRKWGREGGEYDEFE